MLELVRALKIEFVITLGGLLADTPHTRPVPVTDTADGEVATKLVFSRSSYEGAPASSACCTTCSARPAFRP